MTKKTLREKLHEHVERVRDLVEELDQGTEDMELRELLCEFITHAELLMRTLEETGGGEDTPGTYLIGIDGRPIC